MLILCAFALLTGCQASGGQPVAESAVPAQNASQASATAVPPTATSTLAPTATVPPTATETLLPSPTPTLALPVRNGQDLPALSLAPLSAGNASSLVEIARYGNAKYIGYVLNDSGSRLLAINTDGFRVYDLAQKKLLGKISVDVPASGSDWINGRKLSVAGLSADGQYVLARGAGSTVDLWQVDGQKAASFEMGLPQERVQNAAAVSADGSLVALSICTRDSENDCNFSVQDWKAGKEVFKGRGAVPLFSADGKYFSVNFDRSIDIYSTQDWKRISQMPEPRTDIASGWQKQFSADGQMLATIEAKVVNIWSVADRKLVRTIDSFEYAGYADLLPKLLFSTDNSRVAVLPYYSGRKIIQVVLASGEQSNSEEYQFWMAYYFNKSGSLEKYQVENAETYPDVNSSQHPYFVFDGQPLLYFSEFQGSQSMLPELIGEYRCQAGRCKESKFDAATVASVHDNSGNTYSLQSTETKDQLTLLNNQQALTVLQGREFNDVQAFNDEMLLIASVDSNGARPLAQLVDLKEGKVLSGWPMGIQNGQVTQNWAVFLKAPQGARVSMSDYRLEVFDRASGKRLYDQPGYGSIILPVEQQQKVLLMDAGCVTVVDIAAKKAGEPWCVKLSEGNRASSGYYETASAVSPDGSIAAVGLGGGQIFIYDTATRKPIISFQGHMGEVLALAFDKEGKRLASFSNDGFVKVWAVKP